MEINLNIKIEGLNHLSESLALIGSALAYSNKMIKTSHAATNVILETSDKVEDLTEEEEVKKEVVEKVVTEVVKEIKEEKKEGKKEEVKEEVVSEGSPAISIEQVRALFVEKNSDKSNTPKLKEILNQFNVKKVTDLEEKDFGEVIELLRAI